MSDFRIVRVHNDPLQPGGGVQGLESAVASVMAEGGWRAAGGPFLDSATNHWCQALTRPSANPAVSHIEQPGSGPPMVHSDPQDKPIRLREPKA